MRNRFILVILIKSVMILTCSVEIVNGFGKINHDIGDLLQFRDGRKSGMGGIREMLLSGTQPEAELRIKGFVATAAGNGLRVAPGARVLLAAIWALIPVANGAQFSPDAFAA
jgi:hypothetical protein